MYTPERYKNENTAELVEFITKNSFGILISHHNGKHIATHIPIIVHRTETEIFLTGHVSKENEQAESILSCAEALAIFNGPHAYVSSSWYNHENVSTWNYIAVHAYGKLRPLEELELVEALIGLTEKYESKEKQPKYFENIDPKIIRDNITGITGFKMVVEKLQANYKLSQNRNAHDYQNIIQQLDKREDEHSKMVAEEMRKKMR